MVGTIEKAVEKGALAGEAAERRRSETEPERPERAPDKTFSVSLVTPDGAAFEGEAEMLIVPGADGEIGVLARHAPLIATLKAGSTRVHVGATRTCTSSQPAPASSRWSRTARSRSSTTRSTRREIDVERARGAARGGAGGARADRARRVGCGPLADRAAHPARREPARRLPAGRLAEVSSGPA